MLQLPSFSSIKKYVYQNEKTGEIEYSKSGLVEQKSSESSSAVPQLVSEAEPSFVAPSPVLADSNLEVEPICEDQSTSSNSTKRLMPPESNIAETSPPKKIQKSNLKSTVKKVKTKESKSKKKHPVLKMVSKWQEIQEQFK